MGSPSLMGKLRPRVAFSYSELQGSLAAATARARDKVLLLPGRNWKVKDLVNSDAKQKQKEDLKNGWINTDKASLLKLPMSETIGLFFSWDSLTRRPCSSSALLRCWSFWAPLWEARPVRPTPPSALQPTERVHWISIQGGWEPPPLPPTASILFLPGGRLQSRSQYMGNKTYQHALL